MTEVVQEKGGELERVALNADPDSRLHDPFDPDREPLPPDDPQSHELMHSVDGHRGWKHWHDNGETPSVDLESWYASLPRDQNGEVVVNLANAVDIARKNSREYQTEIEDLYLSALDVTFERFRFDSQFFLGNSTQQTFDGMSRGGGRDKSELNTTTRGEIQKMTATGGELVVGLANSLVWQFSGKNSNTVSSVFDFTLVQPLLQFGGRARVLEQLTQRERTLLANVRQMEQFRRGFYVNIVAGRRSGEGPSRSGNVGQSGLGLVAGLPSGRAGAAPVGGFLGVLQEAQQIRNRDTNLAALREGVAQLEAYFESGRLPIRLQVDQTRQAYYNAQSNLLSSRAGYSSRLDDFKMSLGLPPHVPVQVQDELIDRFNLIDPSLTLLLNEVNDVLDVLRKKSTPLTAADLQRHHTKLLAFEDRVQVYLDRTRENLDAVQARFSERVHQLQQLQRRITENDYNVDRTLFDPALLKRRLVDHGNRLDENTKLIRASFINMKAVSAKQIEDDPADAREDLEDITTKFSGVVLDSMLTQAAVRLESIDLVPVEMQEATAMSLARENRLDWMNARANLVDSWRKIEFAGNALQSNLNVVLSGDMRNQGDNPLNFNSDTGRLRMGFEFDTPITRLQERNRYRESLVEYQRARRNYMLFEDQINQSVRNTLRVVDLSQVNFEIRRAALFIAISQVSLARMRLNEPAKGVAQAPTVSPTTARDLVTALDDLLNSQNDLLNAWVSYEVLRLLLDFELGTMQFDGNGLWRDPGSIVPPNTSSPEPIPLPPEVPALDPGAELQAPLLLPNDPAAAPAPPKAAPPQAAPPKALPNDGPVQPTSGWRATR